jgi:hypothetical protein
VKSRTVEVPFMVMFNRRCLTDRQLFENPELKEFVTRFSDKFEYDIQLAVWWFIEEERHDVLGKYKYRPCI